MRERIAIACCALFACTSPSSEALGTAAASKVQPLWTATTTQPSVARADMPALLLPNGRVLVAGGLTATGATAATELFDPATETWTVGPTLSQAQSQHVVQLWEGLAACAGATRVEALDPTGTTWQTLGAPAILISGAAGVTLADGRLLVVGGPFTPNSAQLLQADGGWVLLASTTAQHQGHTATLLASGNIEVIGGPTAIAEQYNPTTNVWLPLVGPALEGHTSARLPSGELLVIGGRATDGGIASAQRYNPTSGLSTNVSGLRVPRVLHASTSLPGGDVLVTGGDGDAAARSAERYIVALDRFVASGCLVTPRSRHAQTMLTDGGVLLVGGVGLDGGFLAKSERLDFSQGLLAPGQPCALDCECGTGFCADGVCCDQACQGACLACSAAAGAATDGTCGLVGPSRICRPSAGSCDVDDHCTGADAGCPGDAVAPSMTTCRGVAGTCDVAEVCDGVSAQCPVDGLVGAGTSCRAAVGDCDVTERCTGSSPSCGPDLRLDAGVICRLPVAGGCDVAEACDGVGTTCPPDVFADAGIVCRAADAGCDLAEVCNGTSAVCPPDSIAFPGTVCRPALGPCDVAEVCTGLRACPPDAVADAGLSCRAAAGSCDVADVCDGVQPTCVDLFVDAGVVCAMANGACDAVDVCDGAHAACRDTTVDAGVLCRIAVSACDKPEVCDGITHACPADAVQDAGYTCRPAAAPCDMAEVCDGMKDVCPPDGAKAAGAVCRAPVAACDAPELCDGVSTACPADLVAVFGHPCRLPAGVCDVEEVCDGASLECPADVFQSAATVCRPATASCDTEELCDGTNAVCPADVSSCDADAGVGQQHYVGWSCACGETSFGPGLLLALFMLGRSRRRFGAAAAVLAAGAAHAEAPVVSDFAVRLDAHLLRDLLAPQLGAEIGANVSLASRFDLGAAASLGRSLGGRLGVTWHIRDDGEWVRPFISLRALIHSVPEGLATGGGAWAGILVPLGPGRIQAGGLVELYAGPKAYAPYDVFVTLGYEIDLYRRIDREGQKAAAAVEAAAAQISEPKPPAPRPAPPSPEPKPKPVEPKAEPKPAVPEPKPAPKPEPNVVTRISFSRDLVLFAERRSAWDAKNEVTVRRVAEALKRYPQLKKVEIGGHADDGDSDAECLKISERRADAVMKALVAAGVEPARLVAKAYGNTRTRVSSKGPARKREQNRRVDFNVLESEQP